MPSSRTNQEELDERVVRQQQWRAFRHDYPLTQTELAEYLEISRRSVQAVEAGAVTPRPKTLRRFMTIKIHLLGKKLA